MIHHSSWICDYVFCVHRKRMQKINKSIDKSAKWAVGSGLYCIAPWLYFCFILVIFVHKWGHKIHSFMGQYCSADAETYERYTLVYWTMNTKSRIWNFASIYLNEVNIDSTITRPRIYSIVLFIYIFHFVMHVVKWRLISHIHIKLFARTSIMCLI